MSRWRRAAWLTAWALGFFLSFPHPLGERVLDLGLPLAWLAPAALLLGLRGLAPRAAARVGFLAGVAAFALVFHWIYVATVRYGNAPVWIGLLAPLLLACYPAAFVAAFGAAVAALRRHGLASPFAIAALWTALEHARSFVATGFPWALLGYAQHANPPLLELAPWTGVYGPSFVVALGGAALAAAWMAQRRRAPVPRGVWLALVAIAGVHLAGLAPRGAGNGPAPETLRVGIVQGNVDQGVKWSPAWAERTLADYETLTRQAAAEGARLVLWPETAVPGSPDYDTALADRLASLARETRATLVVGAVGFERLASGARYADSAFVIGPGGRTADRYDKSHLVPFGEYVPLRGLLGRFIGAIATGAATTDVTAGELPRALAIPDASGGAWTGAVPICYELLFPDLVRRFVRDGAEALLAITNDAWYGRTGAPYQTLVMTAMRSAENRVWTARAANTGVSALIDERGRVRMQTKLFEQTVLVADLPLRPAPLGGSFYARHGDWFAAGCWAAVGVLGVAALARRRARA